MSEIKDIPTAKPAGSAINAAWNARISIIWVLPMVAAIVGGYLIFEKISSGGPLITITFGDGGGLQPGQTSVRYRGVKVGTVQSVTLTQDGGTVEVDARLDKAGARLAREGSRFWVVRPDLNAGALRGLETIVSGSYIQVEPGTGPEQMKFTGGDQPPLPGALESGLDLVLTTPHIGTLNAGAPVYYRGLEVGTVQGPMLNGDATGVNIRVQIQQRYASLVRQNTVFWNAGGLEVRLKFFSVNVNAESMKSLVVGGIAFATPTPPGPPAGSNEVFVLNDKLEEKWLKWAPPMPGWLGTNSPPTNTPPVSSLPTVGSLTNASK